MIVASQLLISLTALQLIRKSPKEILFNIAPFVSQLECLGGFVMPLRKDRKIGLGLSHSKCVRGEPQFPKGL